MTIDESRAIHQQLTYALCMLYPKAVTDEQIVACSLLAPVVLAAIRAAATADSEWYHEAALSIKRDDYVLETALKAMAALPPTGEHP